MDDARIDELRRLLVAAARHHNAWEPDDIAQDVLFRAWRLGRLVDETPVGYFRVAARNAASDERRKRSTLHIVRLTKPRFANDRSRRPRSRDEPDAADPPDRTEPPTAPIDFGPLSKKERRTLDDAVHYYDRRSIARYTGVERVHQHRRIARLRRVVGRETRRRMMALEERQAMSTAAAREWAIMREEIKLVVVTVDRDQATGLANLSICAYNSTRLRWSTRRPASHAAGVYGLLRLLRRFLIAIAEMSAHR